MTDLQTPSMSGAELAVLSARFDGVARKMANTLHRTGRSEILTIARDFSCIVLTAQHELVTAADSLPIHVLRGPEVMSRAMTQNHPALRRGDAFLQLVFLFEGDPATEIDLAAIGAAHQRDQ